MFNTTSNQVLKIHKGDDSGFFSLFINKGTKQRPIQYKFYSELSVAKAPEDLKVQLNKQVFQSQIINDGFFDFEYNYLYDEKGRRIGDLGWYFNGNKVELSAYGISYIGKQMVEDHIIIAQFKEHVSEVYLYILDINADLDDWIIKKTFFSAGEVMTEFARCDYGTLDEMEETVDRDHNIKLHLSAEDTAGLKAGEYNYQIRARLYIKEKDEYVVNTITNRLPLYVVDGEDSTVW